jgi:hypothetical protein
MEDPEADAPAWPTPPGSTAAVADAGLAHVAGLTNLDMLSLAGTTVADAGLVHLRGLTGLRHLTLNDTAVTPAGLEDLRRHLPQLQRQP